MPYKNKEDKNRNARERRRKQGELYRLKERIRHRTKRKEWNREYRKKNKEKIRKYHKKYMQEYRKSKIEKEKNKIRMKTYRMFGKTPKGYHRHHENYKNYEKVKLIPINKHYEVHWKW